MEYQFIVNPKSRSGRGGMVWNLVEPELKKRRIKYQVYYTEYARHAIEIAAGITADGKEHTLVVVGGDGTVDEAVNGICDCSKVTLGYIPTGSGNDFTRALRLPADIHAALENILDNGYGIPMDIGRVRCAGKVYRFAVSTGIGFDAAVCHQAAVSPVKVFLNKLGLGKLTYLVIALQWIFSEKPMPAEIQIDGGKILLLLPTAFFGKHVNFKGISIYRCREIKVKMGKKLPIHADGEPIAVEQTINAALEPEQIRVIAPSAR